MTLALVSGTVRADDPTGAVREGLQLYRQEEFEKARDKFASARLDFDKADAAKAAVAAFDEACASHRKGDLDHAREWYLKAGLAHDKKLAAAAHFNLGTLAAGEARRLAGERPEEVPPDKRQEILDQLKVAVASFRHCLELRSDNARARRDIELVRQWIRFYSSKWHERDRQKRREESNLLAFLEFLMETQGGLKETVKSLPATASADAFAEVKRLQDELQDEIDPLKEKIRNDLQPAPPAGSQSQAASSQELDEGIKLLQSWANTAGEKMSAASRELGRRRADPTLVEQQAAIDELEKIWEAVVPFAALLARDLADQTKIVRALEPESAEDPGTREETEHETIDRDKNRPAPRDNATRTTLSALGSAEEDLAGLADFQEQTRRRTELLKFKAEAELERLEKSPPETDDPADAGPNSPKPADPEQLKAGFQKAIDLSPQAAQKMEATVHSLHQKDRRAAYPPAEEARKILEEIQQAQPRNEQQDKNQQDQDQKKQDEKNQDKQKDDEKKQQDQQDQKQDEQKKQDDQKKQDEKDKSAGRKENQKQPQMSRDQIEEALRKVRERQQEKRERDRKMKARVTGRAPVDKDW